jgi:hypothetical protein
MNEDILKRVKLKHLRGLEDGKPNYSKIMRDVLNFRNILFFSKILFKKKFIEACDIVGEIAKISPSDVLIDRNSKIKAPFNIDNISYLAMLEIQTYSKEDESVIDMIADIVCIACYSSNRTSDYDHNSDDYKTLREEIINTPFKEIFGLYNWIDRALVKSAKTWNKNFLSVQVLDSDYEDAGGDRMKQFNVINTVKSICKDFNKDYDSAWQMPYGVVQMNSLEKATQSYIQTNLGNIREKQMLKSRSRVK